MRDELSMLRIPALDPATVPGKSGWDVPEPFRSRARGRLKRALGDATGLTQFGVNLVTLHPGDHSALRHWHTQEDEFVYVLSGELVLITNAGEQALTPGMCAGFPAAIEDAHSLANRSSTNAQYLEIGSRIADDCAHYPDDDVAWIRIDGEWRVTRKDGSPLL